MCNAIKNKLTQLVEIVVPGIAGGNNTNRIQFTDQPYLRFKSILSLETYTVSDLTTSPQGNAVVTAAQLQAAYITLYTSNPDSPGDQGEWIQLLPMWNLHTLQNAANEPFERNPFLLAGQQILWEKCYINLGAPLANTANVSFLLNVGFQNQLQ
jgi:hypothetical protein